MASSPTMWVFDAAAIPEVDTRKITGLHQVFVVLDRLYAQASTAPKASVRLRRLVDLMGRRYSVHADGETTKVPPIWEEGAVVEPAAVRSAIWAVPVLPEAKVRMLEDLVTWARELMLDVYDDELGIYVPADGLPVPLDKGTQFMRGFFRKDARRPWPDAIAFRQAVIQGLTLALSPMGFAFTPREGDDACFTRAVPDGVQRVTALVFGNHPEWRCRLFVEHHSDTIRQGMLALGGKSGDEVSGDYESVTLLVEQFDLLRAAHCPDWYVDERMGFVWLTFCMTPFWLVWMLEDLKKVGLPLLEQLSTAEGVLRVLGGEVNKWFSRNIYFENGTDARIRNLLTLGAVHLSSRQVEACSALLDRYGEILLLAEADHSSNAEHLRRMARFCRCVHG